MKVSKLILFSPLLALIAGAFLSAAYMNWGNPNVQFQRKVIGKQFEALEESEPTRQRVLVVGGSSVSFSIQPQLFREEFGLEVVNLGLPAGAGRGLHCEWALQEMQAGDIVVLAFESTGWTEAEKTLITPLGSQFWYLNIGPKYEWKSRLSEVGVEENYAWTDVRPGGEHLVTLAAKLVFRQPLFRYDATNLREGGYLAGTKGWGTQSGQQLQRLHLAPLQRQLLKAMDAQAERKGAKLVVSLPWLLVRDDLLAEQRQLNRILLDEIAEIVPVLDDEKCGACERKDWFADTHWHLTEEGATMRSRVFGDSIVNFVGSRG